MVFVKSRVWSLTARVFDIFEQMKFLMINYFLFIYLKYHVSSSCFIHNHRENIFNHKYLSVETFVD